MATPEHVAQIEWALVFWFERSKRRLRGSTTIKHPKYENLTKEKKSYGNLCRINLAN